MKSINDYIQELYFYSLQNERKQSNYIKNKQQLKNIKSGEVLSIQYDFNTKQKAYVKTTEQKVHALVSLTATQALYPIFCTLTLPSEFHPYTMLKNGKQINNKKFKFKSLDEAIIEGYQELKNIYRIFYKRVKSNSKNIYYIKVVEPHKSLIPHMHVLLFVEENQKEITKQLFYKVCKEHKLKRVEFDESLLVYNINNAVAYIMKYVLKTINSNDEYFKRWLDGWRRRHRILAVQMSNLPITIEVYKKLYYNLPAEEKKSIQKEIEKNNQSFFEYFIHNSKVHQIIYEEENMSG